MRVIAILFTLGLSAMLIVPAAQAAERIYRWVDKDNNVVYSDTPPPQGVDADRVQGAPQPTVDPEAAMESLRERAKAFDERREERLEGEQEAGDAADREKRIRENCEQLRKNLEVIQTSARVREKESGEEQYTVLSEEQRQARLEATRKRIADECSGAD